MATCARSHGGDGGDRPPRGRPTRIPRGCESSLPKKVRGRGASKDMHDLFAKNKKKFELELDPKGTFRFVGENGSMFIRCLSNDVWHIPLHHETWEKVPENDKLRVFRTLHNYFNLLSWVDKPEWPGIRKGINDDCAKKYRDHKATSKRHFDAMGGYDDLENARKNHPDTHTSESWNRLIDNLYLDEKYRLRSERNAENRKKQLYPSRGGSKSFASRRYEDMQTSGTMRLIENWREMHFHPKKGWVTEKAEEHWEKIERERTRMQEEAGDLPIDEEECLTRVLGPRRGWTRGIGRKVPKIGPDVSCVVNSTSQAEHDELKEHVRLLTQSVQHLTAKVEKMENQGSSQQEQNEDEDEGGNEFDF